MSDPFYSSVSLLLHCNGTNGSTVFVDDGPGNYSVVASGDAAVSTSSPMFGTGCYSATSGKLSISQTTPFAFGTGDFTIEGWGKTAAPTSTMVLFSGVSGSNDNGILLYINGGQLNIQVYDSSVTDQLDMNGGTIPTSTWFHWCLMRTGDDFYLYVDGVVADTDTNSVSVGTPGLGVFIGNDHFSTPWNGQLDEVRITKGVARYSTSGFTPSGPFDQGPPVPAVGAIAISGYAPIPTVSSSVDPDFADVSLLLHCDGTDGSTSFTDSSTNNFSVDVSGDAAITTTGPKFGTGAYLSATGGKLNVVDGTAFSFPSSDFTVEGWAKADAIGSNMMLAAGEVGVGSTNASITIFVGSSGKLFFGVFDNTNAEQNEYGGLGTSINTTDYFHWALIRVSGNFYFFHDGVQEVDGSGDSTVLGAPDSFSIGNSFDGSWPFIGRIDEVRVTKGLSRYTSAGFTPPTAPFFEGEDEGGSDTSITVPVRAVHFTGHTPQVTVSGSPTTRPSRGTVTFTGRAPKVTIAFVGARTFNPGTGTLATITGYAPSLVQVANLHKSLSESITVGDSVSVTLGTGMDFFTLPPFLQSGHQLKDGSISAEIVTGIGDPRVRRTDLQARTVASGSWQMNLETYGLFTIWYEDFLRAGADQFDVQVMNYGPGLQTVRAIFIEPYTATTDDGLNFTVAAKLQIGSLTDIPVSLPSGAPSPYAVYFLDTFTSNP